MSRTYKFKKKKKEQVKEQWSENKPQAKMT